VSGGDSDRVMVWGLLEEFLTTGHRGGQGATVRPTVGGGEDAASTSGGQRVRLEGMSCRRRSRRGEGEPEKEVRERTRGEAEAGSDRAQGRRMSGHRKMALCTSPNGVMSTRLIAA
jgi:hypothetical protein